MLRNYQACPTAIISDQATIEEGVEIGSYTLIEDHVFIGQGTKIGSHVQIKKNSHLGKFNHVYFGAVIGGDPQDLKFEGEITEVKIGDANTIREYVTINRGTRLGGGITQIGNNNYFMSHVHIGHDCFINNNIVIAQSTCLGGHVEIEDHAMIGGVCGIHQFCKIGTHAMIGGCSRIVKDVLPYSLVQGNPSELFGPNSTGLKRHHFNLKERARIKMILKLIKGMNYSSEDLKSYVQKEKLEEIQPIHHLINFLEKSSRGVYR
jgi:UDP-N-acetylglucosamine acyltransferase